MQENTPFFKIDNKPQGLNRGFTELLMTTWHEAISNKESCDSLSFFDIVKHANYKITELSEDDILGRMRSTDPLCSNLQK